MVVVFPFRRLGGDSCRIQAGARGIRSDENEVVETGRDDTTLWIREVGGRPSFLEELRANPRDDSGARITCILRIAGVEQPACVSIFPKEDREHPGYPLQLVLADLQFRKTEDGRAVESEQGLQSLLHDTAKPVAVPEANALEWIPSPSGCQT